MLPPFLGLGETVDQGDLGLPAGVLKYLVAPGFEMPDLINPGALFTEGDLLVTG